ncbi:C4-dicarboxylate TRAP transporter large permease protein DctM [subsurface metagenome]
MTLGLSITVILFLLFSLLGSGLYIGLSLAGVGVFGFEFLAHRGEWVSSTLYNSVNSFILTAIPFFLFMGQIVLHSGLSARLYRGVSQWARVIPGGLLHSNILSCAVFAAVSGSSPATAATIGTVAYPEQKERGYDSSIVTGSLAAGGTLGILIPPSINMIIYGAFVGVSVGRLFAAGIVPGVILALVFMVAIAFMSTRNKSLAPIPEKVRPRYFLEAVIALKDIWPFFAIIGLIMGSIYGGIMTPTEAAAASAFLAIIFGTVIGKMNFTILKDSALASLQVTGMYLLIYVGASLMGNAISALRIPAQLSEMVAASGLGPLEIWFGIVLLYLILGCFMDTLAMMLVTLPVVFPLVVLCGFDPIWFGVELVLLCEIGMITPPVGINLFVLRGIAPDVGLWKIVRGVLPFFLLMLVGVVVLTFVPQIALFLPTRMLG